MIPIHPINEASCCEHYGKPVLIILKDGGEIAGILTKVENDRLILNGDTSIETTQLKSSKKSGRAPVKIKKNKSQARVANSPYPFASPPAPFYPPVSPFGGRGLFLDLALIAFLFLLI
jgi:small nuclear ribonucleoprotein (snRNP)-like protein